MTNSYHCLLERILRDGSTSERWRLVKALAQRGLDQSPEARLSMKWTVIDVVLGMPPPKRRNLLRALDDQLMSMESPPMLRLISDEQGNGAKLVLATAAPDLYASEVARRLGFDACIATSTGDTVRRLEMIGATKALYCRKFIEQKGPFEHVHVVTDHPDDIAMIRLANEVTIHSSPQSYSIISNILGDNCSMTLIDDSSEQDGGGNWLWMTEQFVGPISDWETMTVLSKHRYALLYIGQGRWRRASLGKPIHDACRRSDPPVAPGVRQRLSNALANRIVRHRLGVFH